MIEVKSVKVTIGSKSHELSIEEAKQLRDKLLAAFPVQNFYWPGYWPYYPSWNVHSEPYTIGTADGAQESMVTCQQ